MMKLIKASVLLVFILFAGQGVAAVKGNKDTVVIKTNIYCNHCMKCESCKGKLDQILDEKGVVDMTLNVEAMTITVVYKPKKTSPEVIRKAISKLGYDADDIPADPEAVKGLDGCCHKPE